MMMFNKTYLVFFCSVLIVYVASENIIQFHYSATSNSEIYCKENRTATYLSKSTVLENEEFKIQVDEGSGKVRQNPYINYLNCSGGWNMTNIIVKAENEGNSVTRKAEKKMGGIWQCMILTNKNINTIKPLQFYKNDNYTRADCQIKVHVRLLEPPQLILINRIELKTTRELQESAKFDHIATYNYSGNDIVDVFCVDVKKLCDYLEMTYDYAQNLDNMFKRNLQSVGVGFRTRLRAEHNNSSMICRCIVRTDETVVKVIFTLRQDFDDTGIFQINNLPIRQRFSFNKNLNYKELSLNYWTLDDESVNIVCASNSDDIKVEKRGGTKCTEDSENSNISIYVNVTIKRDNKSCDLTCSLSENDKVIEYFAVNLSNLNSTFNDNSKLYLDFIKTGNNNIVELYEYKKQKWIYYEYQDGDNVTITCTKFKHGPGPLTYINVNGSVIQNASSSTDIQLTSIHDNTEFKCELKEKLNNEPHFNDAVLRIINVMFHERKPQVTEPTTVVVEPENDDSEAKKSVNESDESSGGLSDVIIVVIVIVVICIVLVCVSTILCKMRNRKTPVNPSTPNYEDLQRDDSFQEPIPAYPPQWSHENPYHVPIDQRTTNDNIIYSEPIREGNYATPLPKHLRPKKPKQPTYASLDLKPSDSSANFNNSDSPQYAEVRDLNSQVAETAKSYDNVFTGSRYVNSKNTDYVEPTYTEAYFK